MKSRLLIVILSLLMIGCMNTTEENRNSKAQIEKTVATLEARADLEKATFAGGCFWCSEASFQEEPGVVEAVSGYAGGEEINPSYEDVVYHRTGHREATQVYYNPKEVSYDRLLEIYWNNIDPIDGGGQYADRGFSYTTVIYYHNDEQKEKAEKSKKALEESGKYEQKIATEILPFTSFYHAEDEHQDFYKHSAERYQWYKEGSGRK